MHKTHDAFHHAGRRARQEMVAAINAVDRKSACAHRRLAALHAGRAASIIAAN